MSDNIANVHDAIIYTDSMSAIQSLESKNERTKSIIVCNIENLVEKLKDCIIQFVWIPAHVGIYG